MAVADAVITSLNEFQEKADFHREYSCYHTLFELIRRYEESHLTSLLYQGPPMQASTYREYKTAELMRLYYAYTLMQTYLEYYAAPGTFEWVRMGADVAVGVVQAPMTAGWSAVGPVVTLGDDIVTQIFAYLESETLQFINTMATNTLANLVANGESDKLGREILESLYLAPSDPDVPTLDAPA